MGHIRFEIMPASNDQDSYEDGLVRLYFVPIRGAANGTLQGTDPKPAINTAIKEAISHFSGVLSSSKMGNLRRLRGQVAMAATCVHPSQPKIQDALEYAQTELDKAICEQEKNEI